MPNSTCIGLLLSGAFLTASLACAQSGPCSRQAPDALRAPISTDRPQITSSSVVVPCGSLQLENGLTVTGENRLRPRQRTWDLPETSLRLGLLSKTELRLGVPNYFQNSQAGSGYARGLGDLTLGFKQQLGPSHGIDLSLLPAVSLPTGARALSSHGYDPSLQLPWSRSLSKGWTAAGMFSLAWPTEGPSRNLTGQASLYFDRQLTAPLDAYLEYSGAFAQRGGPQHQVGFGTAFKPSPHQQIDLHCGFGLSNSLPGFSLGIGYSVRFQAFAARQASAG